MSFLHQQIPEQVEITKVPMYNVLVLIRENRDGEIMKLARYQLPDYYQVLGLKEGATQEEIDAVAEARSKRIYEHNEAFEEAYGLLKTEEGREWYRSRVAFEPNLKPLHSIKPVLNKSELVGKVIWAVGLVLMLYLMAGFIPHHFFFDNFMFYLLDMVVSTAVVCFLATKLIKLRDKHFEPMFEEIKQHNLAVDYENEKIYKKEFGENWSEYKDRAIIK